MSVEATNTTGSSKKPKINTSNSTQELKVENVDNKAIEEKLNQWGFEFRAFAFEDRSTSSDNKNADKVHDVIVPTVPARIGFLDKAKDIIEGIAIKLKGKAKAKNKGKDIEM